MMPGFTAMAALDKNRFAYQAASFNIVRDGADAVFPALPFNPTSYDSCLTRCNGLGISDNFCMNYCRCVFMGGNSPWWCLSVGSVGKL